MKRRSFLSGSAALSLLPAPVLASQPRNMSARASSVRIAPSDYPETNVWSFDGITPGPELRISQGSRLYLRLFNELDVATSVHWHGIRIDNAMDGVPGVTQPPIGPGESFDYSFVCPDAGTYWYHSHLQSVEQVERGLYGPLIVEEPEPIDVDAEHVLVLDDWRLDPEAQVMGGFDNGHDLSHGGRLGNVVTTNGAMELVLAARKGDRLRLRLINAANARIFTLGLAGMRGWIMATDGMPIADPRAIEGPFLLAPAQRLDLIVDIEAGDSEEAVLLDIVGEERFAQVSFEVSGAGKTRNAPPSPLPLNPHSAIPDASSAQEVTVLIQGGAMRWLAEAESMTGRKTGRELASEGLFWALNGYAGRPEEPLAKIGKNEPVRIRFVNETMWPHAMHLHGHHFYEIDDTGRPGDFRDTTLIQPGQSKAVLFAAHNPGDWLLHCHMLGHHAAGMGTWLKVS